MPHHLFNGVTDRTIVEADASLGFPVISVSDAIEKDYIDVLEVYYAETVAKSIFLDLAHRRLGHISKPLVKMLVKGMTTGLVLKDIN